MDNVMCNRFQKVGAKNNLGANPNGYTCKGQYEGKDEGLLKYTKRKLKSMRYYMKRPILPIGDTQARSPMQKRRAINKYTSEGRKLIHKNLEITDTELEILRNAPLRDNRMTTVAMSDNRIALYIAQKGRCPISGQELLYNQHLHHKQLWSVSHDDSYKNLVLITIEVHKLIHATVQETIGKYLAILKLDTVQMEKLNQLRKLAGNPALKPTTQNG